MSTADVALVVAGVDGFAALAFGWDLLRSGRIRVVSDPRSGPEQPGRIPAPVLPVVPPHPPMAPVTVLPHPPERPGGQPPADIASVFAANVKRLRDARGWTTRDLAIECGLSNSTVTAAENCTGRLYLETAARLAGALGVDVGSMIAGERREEAG